MSSGFLFSAFIMTYLESNLYRTHKNSAYTKNGYKDKNKVSLCQADIYENQFIAVMLKTYTHKTLPRAYWYEVSPQKRIAQQR